MVRRYANGGAEIERLPAVVHRKTDWLRPYRSIERNTVCGALYETGRTTASTEVDDEVSWPSCRDHTPKIRSRAALVVALEQATELDVLSSEALRIIKSLNEAIKDAEV